MTSADWLLNKIATMGHGNHDCARGHCTGRVSACGGMGSGAEYLLVFPIKGQKLCFRIAAHKSRHTVCILRNGDSIGRGERRLKREG